jgi:hypothetical protein
MGRAGSKKETDERCIQNYEDRDRVGHIDRRMILKWIFCVF